MQSNQSVSQNPLEREPKPPFPEQRQQLPGSETDMQPAADHGEKSYRGSARLEGKTAIFTGGDSGIGRAVALAFAREGADILIAYLNEEQDALDTVGLVREAGSQAGAIAGDISDEGHCRQIIEHAMQAFGKIDILVNNAATQKMYSSIEAIPSEEFDYTFRANIYSMFYLCKAAIPHMKPGSTIINTASVQAYQPAPALLPYASTKGAIVTFSKALAQEAIQRGIRVNVVAPGPVWTPLIPASADAGQTAQFGKNVPMQRPAQPAEIAPAYVFLASHESSYIVGEVIGLTGGKMLP
jgi:NAD(P)-dependent dehydrogenase (short-subunit alcohol dehydrogenase family)